MIFNGFIFLILFEFVYTSQFKAQFVAVLSITTQAFL
jgi:hypothetical protein